MQRVDAASADGPAGRHERLARHLASEDALSLLLGLGSPEDVDLDCLKVEQADQLVEGFAHRTMLAGADPCLARRRHSSLSAQPAVDRIPGSAPPEAWLE